MKRLLMVTPRYTPCSGADSRRAQQLAPRLAAYGWQARILAAHCSEEDGEGDTGVHRIGRPRFTMPGWRSPGLRSLGEFDRMAQAIHAREPFDLALFTNTDFATWRLGPRWSTRWGTPFVLDWQDPWYTTYYDEHPRVTPPGGRVKFAIANALARRWEGTVAPAAAGHILVSAAYDDLLVRRYPGIANSPRAVIPIAFEPPDAKGASLSWRPDGCGSRFWAAVGRGGPDMAVAASRLFRELAAARQAAPNRFAGLQLWFVGTDYAPASRARPTIAPIAAQFGLDDCVFELPTRIPEHAARAFQRDAEALVVLGSDDPGYMPSKLFGDLDSGKPLVTAFGADSTARGIALGMPGVFDVSASDGSGAVLLDMDLRDRSPGRYARDLSAFDADAMSARVAALLDEALARAPATHGTDSARATARAERRT